MQKWQEQEKLLPIKPAIFFA